MCLMQLLSVVQLLAPLVTGALGRLTLVLGAPDLGQELHHGALGDLMQSTLQQGQSGRQLSLLDQEDEQAP